MQRTPTVVDDPAPVPLPRPHRALLDVLDSLQIGGSFKGKRSNLNRVYRYAREKGMVITRKKLHDEPGWYRFWRTA